MSVFTRRRLLLAGLGGAAGAGVYLYNANHRLPSRDAAAEERFRRAQDALLARHQVAAVSRFVQLPDPAVRAHVLEAGAGEPAVLIHGGNSVAASWLPLLAALQRRYRVYAPDRPGCGLTDKFLYRGVDLRQHAVRFVANIMEALRLDRATVIGNSMGGYFALVFALAHPERVSKLVLIGEPAGSAPFIRPSHRLIGMRIINSLLYATILKPGPKSTRAGFGRLLVADVRRVPADYLDCMTAGSLIPGALESWITMVESATRWNGSSPLTYALRPELPNLVPPTLIVWGGKDTFGPPALGREMVEKMPRGRLEVLPDAGRLAWLDQPQRTAELVQAFMYGGPPGPRAAPWPSQAPTLSPQESHRA